MSRIGFLLLVCIFIPYNSISQTSLDDLNVFFKHNFEENTPGTYGDEEWSRDWLYPSWSDRQVPPLIVRDAGNPENSTLVMEWDFPQGSLGPRQGGGQWETLLNGPHGEMYFSYDVQFKPGFDFVLGGKLPGVFGGNQVYLNKPEWSDGFGATLMFKQEGRIVFYTYSQGQTGQYGESSSWDQYVVPGKWHNLTFRIVMNTVNQDGGNADGILEAFFDGKLVHARKDMYFRNLSSIGIDGLRIYSHFGGGTDDWRNTRDEWIRLDNFVAYEFKPDTVVPRGNVLSPAGRTINYWRKFSLTPEAVSEANNPPVINTTEFLIKEQDFKNNYVGRISAYDADPEQDLTYSIISGNASGIFKINGKTGELVTTTSNLFINDFNEYNITVKVSDNGNEVKSATAPIRIGFFRQSSTYYIDPENNQDTEENGSKEHPYNSWQDVTWRDRCTYLQKRGTTAYETVLTIGSNHVIIGAYGDEDATKPALISNTTANFISGFDKNDIIISGIKIQALKAASCIYFLGSNSDNITIENCVIEGLNNAVRMIEGNILKVRYNSIIGAAEGVFSTSQAMQAYYNVFVDNTVAFRLMNSTSVASIFNNVFYNNQESVSASTAELYLYNNIFNFTNSGQSAVNSESGKLISDYNMYYPDQDHIMEISGNPINKLDQAQQLLKVDMHSFVADPMFVDVYQSNFKVRSGSSAIDAAMNLHLEKDFFGTEVPVSGQPDIGIHEFTGQDENADDAPKLTVYPNPSAGNINILIDRLPVPAGTGEKSTLEPVRTDNPSISIVDMSGRTLLSKLIIYSETQIQDFIDLTEMKNGFYIIVLRVADKIVTEKLILNR